MGLQPDEIGQFVDAFLADHGGIHVGEKKLLAPRRDRLHDNVDRQVAARLAQARFDGLDVLAAGEGDVDRDLVEQPCRARRARAARRARRRRWCESSAGLAGLQMSVATRDMQAGSSGLRQGRAYRRADRQRQVGAGARACAKVRRCRHQRQFHAGLSRSPHHHRAADAWRRRRACRTGSTAMSMRPSISPPAPGWLMRRKRWKRRAREKAADLRRRLRPLFQGADARASRRCRRSLPRYARACARGWSATASRRCMPSLRGAIPSPPND